MPLGQEADDWNAPSTDRSRRPMNWWMLLPMATIRGSRKEIGDLMLHMLFYAKIGAEQGQFTLEEALNGISDKLVFRHPHIYGDVTVKDEEDVKQNWEKLKLKEGKKSVLQGVPVSLPAVVKATRLQGKGQTGGF